MTHTGTLRRVSTTVLGLVACFVGGLSLAAERAELDGVWLHEGSQVPDDPGLTPAGQAMFDRYDPLRDDLDTDCRPVSFTNIMFTPSPPFEIIQHDDHVEINYEFMDVKRQVPLDPTLAVEEAPDTVADHPHMGRSIGRYDGEALIVDTAGQAAGYLDTLGIAGLPQSDQMRTEERFIPNGDRLLVIVTHHDPVYYTGAMVMSYHFLRLDSEILAWGCTLEGANYDDRLN